MPDIDTDNIVVGAFPDEGGVAYISFQENATLPTDAVTPISTSLFDSLGDVSEDGFTESTELSSQDFKDCKGAIVLTVSNTKKRKVKIRFIEAMRVAVLKAVYGEDAVTATGELIGSVELNSKDVKDRPLIIEQLWTNGYKVRYVLDRAKVSSYADVAHNKQSLMGYEMEFTLLDHDGVLGHIYYAKPSSSSSN